MSITRIGETQGRPETVEALRSFLESIMPGIRSTPGCENVMLYQSKDDPTRFIMIEIWDSIESHKEAVLEISPEDIAKVKTLLASPSKGGYFELVKNR